jgi:phosphate/sulfate permease
MARARAAALTRRGAHEGPRITSRGAAQGQPACPCPPHLRAARAGVQCLGGASHACAAAAPRHAPPAARHALRPRGLLRVGQQRHAPGHGRLHLARHRCGARRGTPARASAAAHAHAAACAVGATIGVGIAFGGPGCVQWGDARHGVGAIVLSWLVSPLVAAAFATAFFLATKFAVLRAPDSHARRACPQPAARPPRPALTRARAPLRHAVLKLYPLYVTTTFAVVFFFMFLSGAPALHLAATDAAGRRVIRFPAAVIGVTLAAAVLVYAAAWKAKQTVWFARYVDGIPLHEQHGDKAAELTAVATSSAAEERAPLVAGAATEAVATAPAPAAGALQRAAAFALAGVQADVTTPSEGAAAEAHALAPRYDAATERLFSACQVFTAAFASLAHGSNDVANAVAPLSVIAQVWARGGAAVAAASPTPAWCLAYGGLFIDLGLLLMGYKVMRSLGNNITYHSPSRGFCMELGALTTVLWASATVRHAVLRASAARAAAADTSSLRARRAAQCPPRTASRAPPWAWGCARARCAASTGVWWRGLCLAGCLRCPRRRWSAASRLRSSRAAPKCCRPTRRARCCAGRCRRRRPRPTERAPADGGFAFFASHAASARQAAHPKRLSTMRTTPRCWTCWRACTPHAARTHR